MAASLEFEELRGFRFTPAKWWTRWPWPESFNNRYDFTEFCQKWTAPEQTALELVSELMTRAATNRASDNLHQYFHQFEPLTGLVCRDVFEHGLNAFRNKGLVIIPNSRLLKSRKPWYPLVKGGRRQFFFRIGAIGAEVRSFEGEYIGLSLNVQHGLVRQEIIGEDESLVMEGAQALVNCGVALLSNHSQPLLTQPEVDLGLGKVLFGVDWNGEWN